MSKTKSYVVFDEHGKHSLRKGNIIQSDSGLYYFAADHNKAKRFDSIPRYRMTGAVSEFLKFNDNRTKKHIDSPADKQPRRDVDDENRV